MTIIGEMRLAPWEQVPNKWLPCEGQVLPVGQPYDKLFQLIGNRFGGDGKTTFALPDMRGRAIVGMGQVDNRTFKIADKGGVESVTLGLNQMPAHRHRVVGTTAPAGDTVPNGNVFSTTSSLVPYSDKAGSVPLAPSVVSSTGKTQSHENRQPYLPMRWIISIQGDRPDTGYLARYVGLVHLLAYDGVPVGCIPCDGRTMKVSENGLLAALLKNTYGGDGVNTFGLPDLRCRVPIGAGQGPGLQNFEVGKPGGEFVHTLSQAEMPQHRHAIMAIDSEAKEAKPASQVPAAAEMYAAAPKPADASPMGSSFLEERGGVEQHENTMPYVVLRYVISANGVMPPR